jgi:carotenoid cleavage dioxygenase
MEYEKKGEGIVKIEPKPSNGFTSKAIDLLEKIIVKLFYDSSLPHHWLAGNFAPVKDETPPVKDLPVKGHLPVSQN